MTRLAVRPFQETDRAGVIAMWERCELTRPWNNPSLDIDRKLAADPDGLLVGVVDNETAATVMAGYDGHRGWINYLAVSPDFQGSGFGRVMMDAAVTYLNRLGCPKVNLQIRTSNLDAIKFYESIGYSMDDVVSMGKRLIDDEPPA